MTPSSPATTHDMLRHRQAIRRQTGIVVVDPAEAVQVSRGQAA
jgi:hypothetical protein